MVRSQPAPGFKPGAFYPKQWKPTPAPRVAPFVSSDLDAYVQKYWAVLFTSRTAAVRTTHMRHLVNWYCTRCKTVDLDHHVSARSIVAQLHSHVELERPGAEAALPLPILFVNKRLVGTLEDLQKLEAEKKLKDVLQFGFEWKLGREPLGPLPSAYNDKELFLGRYVGAPIAKPVMKLPSLHPLKQE